MGYQMVVRQMTSRDPQGCCEAILATAWLLVLIVLMHAINYFSCMLTRVSNGHVTNDVTLNISETISDPNTFRARYLENGWR